MNEGLEQEEDLKDGHRQNLLSYSLMLDCRLFLYLCIP